MKQTPAFTIRKRPVGRGHPCFIVAEISGNHHQKYDEAVALVRAAKDAGADAVKLQTYTADTVTLNSRRKEFLVGGKTTPRNWKKQSLWGLYTKGSTPWSWQPKLKRLADSLGMILFSTPFDETAVDFLEKMRVPCYKIASYEATDLVLLRAVARTGKPVIVSFGYSSEDDIRFSLDTLRRRGAREIAALHCVTGYARRYRHSALHLANIAALRERFGVVSGFSDNNAGIEAPLLALRAGASVIEKHLTLSRARQTARTPPARGARRRPFRPAHGCGEIQQKMVPLSLRGSGHQSSRAFYERECPRCPARVWTSHPIL